MISCMHVYEYDSNVIEMLCKKMLACSQGRLLDSDLESIVLISFWESNWSNLIKPKLRKEMFATWNPAKKLKDPSFVIQNSYTSCWFNLMSWRKRILLTCPSFPFFPTAEERS